MDKYFVYDFAPSNGSYHLVRTVDTLEDAVKVVRRYGLGAKIVFKKKKVNWQRIIEDGI